MVFRERGYRFVFFSREEARPHIHVYSDDGEAIFWIDHTGELARNHGFAKLQLRKSRLS